MLKNLQVVTTCVGLSLSQNTLSQPMPRAFELLPTIPSQSASLQDPNKFKTNQSLINELVAFSELVLGERSSERRHFQADRICQERLGVDLSFLASNREKIANPNFIKEVNKIICGDYSFASHPTKPIVPYYLVVAGQAVLKPGQIDVVRQIAPVVARALGLGFKIKIDSAFEKVLYDFQNQHCLHACGQINQETLFKLIELGKLHCSASDGLMVSNHLRFSGNIEGCFELKSNSSIISRRRSSSLAALNAEGRAFFSEIRRALGLQPAALFDGEMEVAILKFRLSYMLFPSNFNGEVTTDLILQLHERNLIQLYQVREAPVQFALTFLDGLLPQNKSDVQEIASRLFSTIAARSRETELALHTSGTYEDFLDSLAKIYSEDKNLTGLDKIDVIRRALEIGIDFPARVIGSDSGGTDILQQFITSDSKFDSRRPSYLILTPLADHNAVFNDAVPGVCPDPLGVNLIYSDVKSEQEMIAALKRGSLDRNAKISLLITLGHGTEEGIFFGLDGDRRSINKNFNFSGYKDSFENNAVWVINSCLTANDEGEPGGSFAYVASKKIPQIYLVAYKEEVDRPMTYVRNSLSEVSDLISNLPPNSRYALMPDGRFLITSSMGGEVPVVIKNGQLIKDFLSHHLSLPVRFSPDMFNEPIDLFGGVLPQLPKLENFLERALIK